MTKNNWKHDLQELLPLLGHRNWILVVDKAFPLQTAAGMTYLNSGEEMDQALSYVLEAVEGSSHIKPVVYVDRELSVLKHIGKEEGEVAAKLEDTLKDYEVEHILHEEVFAKLEAASKMFHVVVIKTESTVAYSSVFMELDCGYWTAEKEGALRELLAK